MLKPEHCTHMRACTHTNLANKMRAVYPQKHRCKTELECLLSSSAQLAFSSKLGDTVHGSVRKIMIS